jgi:hypothetical protein
MEKMNRRIKLTDEQYDLLNEDFRSLRILGDVVSNVLMAVSREAARQEIEIWKTVHSLAEVDRSEDCKVDWITREIIVSKKEQDVRQDAQ